MNLFRPCVQLAILLCIGVGIGVVTPLSAHTVEQLFMTFEKKEHDWSIKITFDAGYALPELRDDATSPQPQRAWLVAKNAQQHQRLRDEASKYIYATLTVGHGGKQLPYTISFPDYQSSPPSFPVLLNGGAYFNTILTGPLDPAASGKFSLTISSAAKPNFVVSHSGNASKNYTVITPGSTEVLFSSLKADTTYLLSPASNSGNVAILKIGYLHVLPHGIDHILFILTLFLMARRWQPLLYQSLAFTLAHSLTLALVSLNIISLSSWTLSQLVEPAIALSVVTLSCQNIICKKPSSHRLPLVFFFGLIHGLGFASSLEPLIQDNRSSLINLFLANAGVELAQITILALAWLLTIGWWQCDYYQRFRILLSAAICAAGLFWLLQRLFFP